MLTKEIRNGWAASATGYAAVISSITNCGYEGWTIKTGNSYGVALPAPQNMVVSEKFAGAHLYTDTIILDGVKKQPALLLMARSEDIKGPFSTLCAELLLPRLGGCNGKSFSATEMLMSVCMMCLENSSHSVILLHMAKTQNGTVLLELHMTLIAMESSMKSNPQQQGISEKLL